MILINKLNNNSMKKILNIFLITALLGASSCDLNLVPESSVSSVSYWKNEDDARSAVNGIYARFQSSITNFNWMYWFEARGGNIAQGLTPTGIISYTSNDITSALSDTNWSGLYSIISQCNAVINNIDKVKYANVTTRNQLLAEALFFRAWCYFNLTRLWGDVPLMTEFIENLDSDQLYPERTPKADVNNFVLKDIDEAEKLYVATTIPIRNRVSRAAILMLKTEINLWLYKTEGKRASYLTEAEKAVDGVLALPAATLALQAKYSDVFDREENTEIIFSIYYDLAEKVDQYGLLLAQSNTLVPSASRNNPVIVGNSANHVMMFSNEFYTRYRNKTANDTRATYISNDLLVGGVNYRYTNKYMGIPNGVQRAFVSDTRIYRLAEAILFKAEILAEKNDFAGAVTQLNKVASRAYGTPTKYTTALTGEAFKETLLDERMIEFAGECKSWFDLIRFGKAFDRVASLKNRQADKKGNILLLPINNDTINRNPKIKQTPGYE
jgi:starch-binding outer membrane protein, SusD/RagB family